MKKYIASILIGLLTLPLSALAVVYMPVQGGTGTSTKPTVGQMLIGNSSGKYDLVSSTTLLTPYARLDGTNQPFTGNLNVSTSSPEIRLTDGDYSRFVRASSSNLMNLYNKVQVIGADGTGGTITHSGPYTIHTFTTTGTSTFTPAAGITSVEVLVVAGGGGGGVLGGGGGGGGVVYHSSKSISGATSVYVGAGGAGATATNVRGTPGTYSAFSDMVAIGGSGGASQSISNSLAGGSTGGTMNGTPSTSVQGASGGGTGYGFPGGAGVGAGAASGGGGGGASATGTAGLTGPNRGGAGGSGMAFAISGATTTYAGGGGGGAQCGTGGAAGSGGGVAGSGGAGVVPAASSSLGGGGGSTGYCGSYGTAGAGGSGVVIVRYIPTTTIYESNVIQSENSPTGGIGGINTFSDDLADTHLTGNTISFDIAGIVKAFVSALGYFGIGTTTPATLLSVAGTSTMQDIIPAGTYTGNVSPYSLGASTTRWSSLWAENVNIGTSTWSLAQKGTRFGIFDQANAGGNEWMSILSSGNIGIGNTNPSQKVEITGSTDTTALINSSNSASYSRIRTTGNGGNVATTFLSSGSASVGTVFGVSTANSGLLTTSGSALTQMLIGTETADPVIIGTNNTARITIASNGSTTISSLGAGFVKSTSGGALYVDNNPLADYMTYSYASSTFPSFGYASSTFLTITDAGTTYVPYTGATGDIDLGSNALIVSGTSTLATTTISELSLGNSLTSSLLAVDVNGKIIATTTQSYKTGVTTGPGFATNTVITHNLGYIPKYIEIEAMSPASSSGKMSISNGFYDVVNSTQGVIHSYGYSNTDPGRQTTYMLWVEQPAAGSQATGTISNIGTSTFQIDYYYITGSSLFGPVLKWSVR